MIDNRDALLEFTHHQVEKIKKLDDDCEKSKALLDHIEVYRVAIDILLEEARLNEEQCVHNFEHYP